MTNDLTALHAHDYPDLVAAQERDQPLLSALGAGNCPTCGRSITPPEREWRYGDCSGGDCNVSDRKYDAMALIGSNDE